MAIYTEYYDYITVQGERLDNLAEKFYGSSWQYQPIVDVNRHILVTPILPGGLRLKIPVLPNSETMTAVELLPPWRR